MVALITTLVDFARGYRQLRVLLNIEPIGPFPPLSVVVAARNEARHIELAARSLLRLDYPNVEIIIVNDRSDDQTGAILERLAHQYENLKIKHIRDRDLPPGWLGKNHALYVGAMAASGTLLLFTDADVIFDPTTLQRAVTVLERDRLDHLTAIPDARVPGVALNAFVSAFGVFFSIYARPWKARDHRSRCHIGIGAFNLIRAAVYQAIGTHRRIAMRPDDDMKLGKLVKKCGFLQDVVDGRNLIVVEWYSSLPELIDALMKNAFAGVNYSLAAVAASTIGLFLMAVWPVLAVVALHGIAREINMINVLLVMLIVWTSNRFGGGRWVYVLAFPAAALLFAYIIWRSALLAIVHGSITWRGTAYSLAEMRANKV
jgi:glycosyltransferase involved in cell wall biosynthesis